MGLIVKNICQSNFVPKSRSSKSKIAIWKNLKSITFSSDCSILPIVARSLPLLTHVDWFCDWIFPLDIRNLNNCIDICGTRLKYLSLKLILINDEECKSIISKCPNLEHFELL